VNWITLAVSICVLIVSVIALFRIQKVHVLVNSQLDKVMARLDASKGRSAQLSQTITDTGGIVPPEKSLHRKEDSDAL
jgi:hypothetical protein